jgi:hypothetical protein
MVLQFKRPDSKITFFKLLLNNLHKLTIFQNNVNSLGTPKHIQDNNMKQTERYYDVDNEKYFRSRMPGCNVSAQGYLTHPA